VTCQKTTLTRRGVVAATPLHGRRASSAPLALLWSSLARLGSFRPAMPVSLAAGSTPSPQRGGGAMDYGL
jgi:hypothetical protein